MTFEELQVKIKEYMLKLPSHRTTIAEAEDLASTFLGIQDSISDVILELETDKNETEELYKLEYCNAFMRSDAKNATEKEAQAKASPEYQSYHRLNQDLESKVKYLRIKLGIFNDAHLLCRNISKEKL